MIHRNTTIAAVLGCLLVFVAGSASAKVMASGPSAVGTWQLNVQKSSYGNVPTPKFEQLVVTADQADSLKWSLQGASVDGKAYFSSYDGPIDGKEHALKSNEAASTVTYTRTGSGLRWSTRDKNGTVMETGSSQVAPDGKTLTIKGTMQGPSGQTSYTSVFEKVQ